MSETNFQPVFDYIDESKKEILKEMATKSDINKLQNSVDGLAKRFDKIEKESTITKARTERVEHWVMQAAEKVEVPYKP